MGQALYEYRLAERLCRLHPGGWPETESDPDVKRLAAAAAKLDKMRGPMHTALDRYARHLSKSKEAM